MEASDMRGAWMRSDTVQEGMRGVEATADDPAGKRSASPEGTQEDGSQTRSIDSAGANTMKDRTRAPHARGRGVDGCDPQEMSDSLQAQAVSVGPRHRAPHSDTLGVARRRWQGVAWRRLATSRRTMRM